MILWIMLAVGLISLAMSIYHPKCVEYGDYLLSGLGTYLLLPASLFIIGASIYCLIAK